MEKSWRAGGPRRGDHDGSAVPAYMHSFQAAKNTTIMSGPR